MYIYIYIYTYSPVIHTLSCDRIARGAGDGHNRNLPPRRRPKHYIMILKVIITIIILILLCHMNKLPN